MALPMASSAGGPLSACGSRGRTASCRRSTRLTASTSSTAARSSMVAEKRSSVLGPSPPPLAMPPRVRTRPG
eukprot:scaffold267188_cov32-Tisochrysis_lutea.AAC.3